MFRPAESRLGVAVCLALAFAASSLRGQVADTSTPEARSRTTDTPIVIPRVSSSIEIDGRVDEPAWDAIEPFPMTMFSPTFRGELTEETEVRLSHDDRYLYLSARMYDSDPRGIRANTFYRDRFSGDDLIAIVLDSYNDYETAVWFITNPTGARQDLTLSKDAEFSGAGMPMNRDWNAHWDVATTRDDQGWYAEFRIPFSTLGFQAPDGDVTMGLVVYRVIARKNERQTFPAMDPAWGGFGFAKPSRAQRIRLTGVRQSTPVYVTPYALGGMTQTPELRQPPEVPSSTWVTLEDPTTEIGADLKYSPTSNLALDVTVNTDFAQVEADQQQVNLTRFPLFFEEKRQFFQERTATFDFSTGGFNNRLFHSRQIGLDDEGEIVRIYGGVRAVGRLGGTDFGFLNMQTAADGGRPTENMGVLRLRQQVLNPHSDVGGMITTRLGARDNVAYGLDTQLRLIGDDYLITKWAQTFDEEREPGGPFESGLAQARWERRREGGLSYYADFIRVGEDYVPGLGFQLRRDFTFWGGQLQYKTFRNAASPFTSFGANVSTGHYYRNADGSAESRSITPRLLAELKSGTEITLSGVSSFESVRDSFPISDVSVEPGEYWFYQAELKVELARNGLFRGDYTATAGTFYDGTRVGLILNPAWNPSRYLELGAGYEINRLDFSDRDLATTIHLARLNVQVALNTRVSLSSFMQYNSSIDITTMNLRFRYHFREGTDLWIVYNEGLHTDRANGLDPRLPLSAGRSFMIKYTHTLIL